MAERVYEFTTILGDLYGSVAVDPEGLQIRSRDALDGHMSVGTAQQLALAVLERWPASAAGERAAKATSERRIRLMYLTTTIVWEAVVPFEYPLPSVGEEIEIGEDRYQVCARVWSLTGLGDIGVGLAIYVRDVCATFDPSARRSG